MAKEEKIEMKVVIILGTRYTVIQDSSLINSNMDGLAKEYEKVISIRPPEEMLTSLDSEAVKQARYREVIRHEVMHSFFTESGLDGYSSDEVLVDWFAKQLPKIIETLTELDALD